MSLTRTVFPFPSRTPSWFAGHMARSLRELPALLDEVDLVLEARDARLPLTSTNHAFDALLERVWGHAGAGPDRRGKGKEKIVVYTKRDLAEERYEAPLKKAFWAQARQRVMFADSRVDADVRSILKLAARTAHEHGEAVTDLKVLVVGMPNVGKSSLLNALRRVGVRRGKAFHTGAMPGVTRKLTGTVRVYDKPPIYVFDTPGVMMPFLGHDEVGAERGLKLALTAGIKEGLFEPDTVADYLLFKLNLRLAAEAGLPADDPSRHTHYISRLPLPPTFTQTDSVYDFLTALAGRLGALRKGGEADMDATINFLLRHFREGKMGRWTLDDLDGREHEYVYGPRQVAEDEQVPVPRGPRGYVVSDLGAIGTPAEEEEIPMDAAGSDAEAEAEAGIPAEIATEHATDAQAGTGPIPATATGTEAPPSATPSTTAPAAGPSLEQRVSDTIAAFLANAAQERADADAGRNRSATQEKKAALKAKAEYRENKARQRNVGADKPWIDPRSSSRTRQAARKARRK